MAKQEELKARNQEKLKKSGKKAGKKGVDTFNDSLAEGAETASESKKTKRVAKDTVDGYVNELEKGKEKAEKAGRGTVDDKSVDSSQKPKRELSQDPRNVRRREQRAAAKARGAAAPEKAENAAVAAKAKANLARQKQLKMETNQANQEANLLAQKQGVTKGQQLEIKKQGVVAKLQERMLKRKQARLAREGKMAVQEAGIDTRKVAGRGMGGAGIMMAASMAPGKVGEVAQRLIMPIMSLSMIIPMLHNPMMALVVVLGALVASGLFLVNSFNESAKKGFDMAKALGSGKDAMETFAKAAGNVTAGEIMGRRRASGGEMFQIQPGKTTFGEAFIQGDEGKQLFENIEKAMDSGGMDNVKNQIVSQMATAIASGALSPGQARSVVAELSKEMGDFNFAIDVNSRLISLLGPDGENLLEDPLAIRVKLVEMTQDNMREVAGPLGEEAAKEMQRGLITATAAGGTGAVLGGVLLKGMAEEVLNKPKVTKMLVKPLVAFLTRVGVTATAGSVVPGLGTAIGAVVGTLAGVALFAKDIKKAFDDAAVAAGAVTATGIMALQQSQEMLDSLQIEYEKRIDIALTAGDIVEAERLQNELIESRQVLLEKNAETMDLIRSNFANSDFMVKGAMNKTLDGVLKEMGGSPVEQLMIDSSVGVIDKEFGGFFAGEEKKEIQHELKFLMVTGQIGPGEILSLVETFKDSPASIQKALNIVSNLGTAEGNRAIQAMNMFEDPEQKTKFLAMVEVQAPESASSFIDFFQEMNKVGNIVEIQGVLGFYLENPTLTESTFDKLQEIKALADEPDVELAAFLRFFDDDPEIAAEFEERAEYFSNLDPEYKTTFVQSFLSLFETRGTEGFQDQLNLFRSEKGTPDATASRFAAAGAERITKARQSSAGVAAEGDAEVESGGSSQKASSALDDLVKKLRDLRKVQIDVTNGFKESAEKINELFGKGKTIDVFEGLEQQMRRAGAGEDLISLIAGMDPEEFNRRKKELFNFDAAGNIISMTNNLRNMGQALKAIALGEFQSEQQRVSRTINEQVVAMRKLTSAGLSSAQAYAAVQNAAFASAVAHETNTKVIRELAKATEEATRLTEAFAAAQALSRKSQDVANRRSAADFAQVNFGALTEAQKELVLTDTDLQALIRTNVDPAALMQALKDAEEKADLELQIKKLTFAGRVEIFEEGFNKAMEKFRVLETEIQLKFAVQKEPLLEEIKKAEREIADIRKEAGGLDELEADLQRIAWKEEEINKEYDRRLEALDQVEKMQGKIRDQNKSQLDLADALSRGDIAGAARAIQEARNKAAAAAAQDRRERIEMARQRQIAAVTGNSGKNREQIERNILSIQKEIFNIEQQRVVPAQRAVELIERQEQDLISGLQVLGRTKQEWEQIKNRVDIAKVSTDEFTKAMEEALDIVEDIVNYWNEFDESPKNIQITETTVSVIEEVFEGDPPIADDPGTGGGTKDPPPADGPPPETKRTPRIAAPPIETEDPDTAGWFEKFVNQPWLTSLAAMAVGTYNVFIKPMVDRIVEEWEKLTAWFDENVVQPIQAAWQRFSDWFDENVVQPVQAAWQRLSDWFDENVVQPIKQAWKDFTDPIIEAWEKFTSWFNSDATFEEKVADVEQFWRDLIGKVTIELQKLITWFKELPGRIKTFITEEIPRRFNEAVDNVVIGLAKITNWFFDLPDKIKGGVAKIGNRFEEIKEDGIQKLEAIGAWFTETLPEKVEESKQDTIERFEAIGLWFTETLPESIEEFKNDSIERFDAIKLWFTETLPGGINTALTQTIPNKFGELKNKANTKLDGIKQWFFSLPGAVGAWIDEKIALYFDNLSPKAREKMEPIINWFRELPGKIRTFITETIPNSFNTLKNNALRNLDGIRAWFVNLPTTIANAFRTLGTTIGNSFKNAFNSAVIGPLRSFRIPLTNARPLANLPFLNQGGVVPGIGNTDTVPAMLTPGEFVIRKESVQKYGLDVLSKINEGALASLLVPTFEIPGSTPSDSSISNSTKTSASVYNNSYSISVNVKSESDPDKIARTVIDQIKTIDSQRIRGSRF